MPIVPAREHKKLTVRRPHLSNQDLYIQYNAIATKSRRMPVMPAKPLTFPCLLKLHSNILKSCKEMHIFAKYTIANISIQATGKS
jgi:hypothetical protein